MPLVSGERHHKILVDGTRVNYARATRFFWRYFQHCPDLNYLHDFLTRLDRSMRVAALCRFSCFALITDSYTFLVFRLIIMLFMSPSSGVSA